jgi:raffinose/stachyose/melibiose transport system permease protein
MKSSQKNGIGLEIIGLLLSFIVLIPVYFVVVNSFKTVNDAADMLLTWPNKFQLLQVIANYQQVFVDGNIISAFINSTIITTCAVAVIIFASAMAGYVMQRKSGKLSTFFSFIVLAGLIVPPAIVPTFWVLKLLHVNGTFLSVIFMQAAIGFPFSTLLYKGFCKTVSKEIDEAAFIDGCSGMRHFFNIIFPLLTPVTTTIALIQFIIIWNDFTIPLYFLSSADSTTLPVTVFMFFGKYVSSWNLVFADVVLIALPVTILYLLAQRFIIEGMAAGAIKG